MCQLHLNIYMDKMHTFVVPHLVQSIMQTAQLTFARPELGMFLLQTLLQLPDLKTTLHSQGG